VVIATPVKHHFSLAKASLLAGMHTFIEKPMASSSAECEELIEIAQRQGLVLMIGHTFLYSSPVRKIAQLISTGDLGEIRYINSRRLNLGLFQRDINVAWDLAPHDISIILHLLGEFPTSVNCSGKAHVTPELKMSQICRSSLAISALPQSRAVGWSQESKEMTIVGTQRMIVYDDLQTHEKSASMMSGWSGRRTTILLRSFIIPTITGIVTSHTSNRKSRSKRSANTSSTASKTGHLRRLAVRRGSRWCGSSKRPPLR
jgi:predicted dehydrogenase